MDILMHKYGKDGRFIESFYSHSDVDVKLEDLQPPKYCVFADQHPLPKVDAEHIPVWDSEAKGWTVKAKAFYERPDYPCEWDETTESWVPVPAVARESSILDSENLIKTIIALKDKIETGKEIPTEISTLVEAERVKLEPVVVEPIIKEIKNN